MVVSPILITVPSCKGIGSWAGWSGTDRIWYMNEGTEQFPDGGHGGLAGGKVEEVAIGVQLRVLIFLLNVVLFSKDDLVTSTIQLSDTQYRPPNVHHLECCLHLDVHRLTTNHHKGDQSISKLTQPMS